MSDDFQKLFSLNKQATPSPELFNRIIANINIQRQARIKRIIAIRSLFFVFSVIILIFGWQWIQADMAKSGFMHFIALLFSDSKILMAYWQSFILVLLESLPVTGLLVLLAAVLAILQSLKFLARDFKLLINNNRYFYGTK